MGGIAAPGAYGRHVDYSSGFGGFEWTIRIKAWHPAENVSIEILTGLDTLVVDWPDDPVEVEVGLPPTGAWPAFAVVDSWFPQLTPGRRSESASMASIRFR